MMTRQEHQREHADNAEEHRNEIRRNADLAEDIDAILGFARLSEGSSRVGWLVNMREVGCSCRRVCIDPG